MTTTKKLICILTAGAAFGATAPVFADPFHGRGHDQYRNSTYYRDYDRHVYRDFDRRRPFVVQRPIVVQRPYYVEPPMYYTQPAPSANVGMGILIGALIGTIIDNHH